MSYAEQYKQTVNNFISGLSPEAQKTVAKSFEQIMGASDGKNALNEGDNATDFSLPNA